MARWKLTAPHYLNVEGTEWQYEEINRATGKPKRYRLPVPLHLHPDLESDWNHVERNVAGQITDGMVVVSDGHNPDPKDIIFTGPPTPDMQPLDDDAKAISEAIGKNWIHPIEGLGGEGSYAEKMLASLQVQIAALQSGEAKPATDTGGMAEMMAMMAKMMQQQTDLMAKLVENQSRVQDEPELELQPTVARRA